jgi:xanthine dehydrogenase YagR molybdenum-binding subunit
MKARLLKNGSVVLQSATTDIGPGTGTAMVQIASTTLGMPPEKISFQLGNSTFPTAPSQGGSSTVNTVGAAVQEACIALKQRLKELAVTTPNGSAFGAVKPEDIVIKDGHLTLASDKLAKVAYADLLKQNNESEVEVTIESKPSPERDKYSMYSYSVHFVEAHVHSLTGEVRVKKVVSCADAGTIVNQKTAGNQMMGGAVGGIGMALTEGAVIDDRFGRYVTKDLADYHVPVHADAPDMEYAFVNKPDPYVNALGTKGIGEIAIIGVAPAIANAVFNATGKRIRELPITPDKLI